MTKDAEIKILVGSLVTIQYLATRNGITQNVKRSGVLIRANRRHLTLRYENTGYEFRLNRENLVEIGKVNENDQ